MQFQQGIPKKKRATSDLLSIAVCTDVPINGSMIGATTAHTDRMRQTTTVFLIDSNPRTQRRRSNHATRNCQAWRRSICSRVSTTTTTTRRARSAPTTTSASRCRTCDTHEYSAQSMQSKNVKRNEQRFGDDFQHQRHHTMSSPQSTQIVLETGRREREQRRSALRAFERSVELVATPIHWFEIDRPTDRFDNVRFERACLSEFGVNNQVI
jgi:hypothetical protein